MSNDKNLPVCSHKNHNKEKILSLIKNFPDEKTLFDLAEVFKVFSDSTRIKILYVLHEGEMCVCDISEFLGMTLSAISHQLRILKQARLVKYRKSGKTVYYSLADDHVHSIISLGLEHVLE